ncbi:hypothetical protein D3C87_1312450 [compost metagenome]
MGSNEAVRCHPYKLTVDRQVFARVSYLGAIPLARFVVQGSCRRNFSRNHEYPNRNRPEIYSLQQSKNFAQAVRLLVAAGREFLNPATDQIRFGKFLAIEASKSFGSF